ncbi:hypothetical protein Droror1_Dr00025105 [Drosera rotundifolia]
MSSSVAPAVAKNIKSEIISSVSNPSLQAAPKSRDPRLRYMNPDVASGHLPVVPTSGSKSQPLAELLNSKKHKITEVPNVDGPAQKKQRNGPEDWQESYLQGERCNEERRRTSPAGKEIS